MFTPVETTIGALLLLQSTTTLLLATGQPLGASSTLGTSLFSPSAHNLPLLAGMLLATAAAASQHLPPHHHLLPAAPPPPLSPRHILAAALVGAGTRLANGCTSGHLLCGVPHRSPRSLAASATFFAAAAITATLSSLWHDTTPACGTTPCSTLALPTPAAAASLLSLLALTSLVSAVLLLLLPRGQALSAAVVRGWAGAVFALGLAVSGMADARKPLRFLTLRAGLWDPSLALVVAGAVVPAAVGWGWAARRVGGRPVVGGEWMVRGREVGGRLLGGSVLFGVGWGLAGVCPGPGVVGLVGGGAGAVGWVLAFWAGWGAAGLW